METISTAAVLPRKSVKDSGSDTSFLTVLTRSIVAYGILPNLFFYGLGRFVYMMRPLVNADYFLVAMIAPFAPVWLSGIAFALLMANELFINVAPLYHFQIVDAIRWIGELRYVSPGVWLPAALGVVALSVGLSLICGKIAGLRAARRLSFRRKAALASTMFGLCAAICAADILNGTSFIALPIHLSFVDVNVAYSGVRRSLMSMLTLYQSEAQIKYADLTAAQSAAGRILAEARAGAIPGRPQLALIVVESMGRFQDPAVTARLLEPLTSPALARRYRVQVESVPFNGHTIEAEFRELCGVQLQAYGELGFPKCLPAYLNEIGYETTGLHGFTNQFYNRYRWYPKTGFGRISFAEDMQAAGVHEVCGSGFKGICDHAVAELLHRQLLKTGKPQFVYWMTLNSHLPLDNHLAADSAFDCEASPATRGLEGPCLHSRVIHRVLSDIAEVAADPQLPPTQFVIVGDHMPPFMSPEARAPYVPTEVPAIVLEPR